MTKARDLANLGAVAATPLMFRNKIINGNFDFWQRSTSYSGVGDGSGQNAYGYKAPDRWWAQHYAGTGSSGSPTFSQSQQAFTPGQTAVPGEPKFFYRFQAAALGTLGSSGAIIRTHQAIEGVRTFAGQKATISFWAKADSSRTYALMLSQRFGTGGSAAALAGQTTFNVTSSWQKFTFTFDVPSISGKTIGSSNDDSFEVSFILYKQDNTVTPDTLGAIGTYTTSAYLDLARVQAEPGAVANTVFEDRPMQTELALCQRYYEKSYDTETAPNTATGTGIIDVTLSSNSSGAATMIYFKATKRAAPTMTGYKNNGGLGQWSYERSGVGATAATVSFGGTGATSTYAYVATGAAWTPCEIYGHWTASAEL